ncbi:MAG: methionyl-tRNA formyltransferase [Alphaproteobacteria bacterium]|nr:methionyl-tRNA formyltransferase [Alphaproteobacteria bacterium]
MARLALFGTPAFAAICLDALLGASHAVVQVYSQPPRPADRGQKPKRSAVHELAEAKGIAVATPRSLKDPAIQDAIRALDLDLAVVVAYGLILPRPVLEAPRRGCLNVHASLLPRWRGAAPIQRAILAGDAETGVCIMRMEEGLDTGPVLASARTPIGPEDDAERLHDRLAALGAKLLVETIARDPVPVPQAAAGATYAKKIDKTETRIDWGRPAVEIERQVRALFPAAWFALGGERVRLRRAVLAAGEGPPGTVLDQAPTVACGTGALRLIELQRQGRGALAAADFLRGRPMPPGTVLA